MSPCCCRPCEVRDGREKVCRQREREEMLYLFPKESKFLRVVRRTFT